MTPGERRQLVFTNLANGLPVERIMEAFHLSEREVLADFEFVASKIRSYRFERVMPPVECNSIGALRRNQAEILHTLTKLNLETAPTISRVKTLPLVRPEGGVISEAEQVMFEMRMRAGR